MIIERIDPFTGERNVKDIDVTEDQLKAWRLGECIQYAMPHLSAYEREFIKTGIMPDSWDEFVDTDSKKNGKQSYKEHPDFNFVNTPTKENK